MNVLSVFDGISCGRVALDRAGVDYNTYYASEIDEYALKIARKNYPDTVHLNDARNWRQWEGWLHNIGLVMGGSPCQGFSISGKRLNFDDPLSKLFFDFVGILDLFKPTYFLFENVGSMTNEVRDKISEMLGVEPIQINSSLVSGQHRNRYYWTNIIVDEIEDKNIKFADILEDDVSFSTTSSIPMKYFYSDRVLDRLDLTDIKRAGKAGYKKKGYEVEKCPPIVARHYKGMQSQPYPVIREEKGHLAGGYKWKHFRKLTPVECERLQTLPDGYTEGLSDTQRYKCLGNAWTVDVITHIFNNIMEVNNNG